jgi:hypothetical protein
MHVGFEWSIGDVKRREGDEGVKWKITFKWILKKQSFKTNLLIIQH